MGAVTKGIPRKHVTTLASLASFSGFVETGTYLGATSMWASKLFETVHTVEASRELFERASTTLGTLSNVVQHLGRSADVLRTLVPKLHGTWLFWLDAHWSAGLTYGAREECPLLSELEIVLRSGSHAVLIDDARLFLRTPPPPHDWRQWPTVDQICATTREHGAGRFSVTIVDDVIFLLPHELHDRWRDHLHGTVPTGHGIAAWLRRLLP